MWFEIMQALQTHLINTPDLNGIPVVMGADAQIPEQAKIILIRGGFEPETNDRRSIPTQTIYIECWEYDKSENPEQGYSKLAALELAVMTAVNAFGFTCVNNRRTQIRIGKIEPDGDAFRPSVGSRTAVTIRWQ